MAKLLIDLVTPGNGKTYEFQLDGSMTVWQAKSGMIGEITELENGNITLNPEKTILCHPSAQALLCESDTLITAGVKSGQRLLLV
jgi:hypothetical protein